MFKHNIELNSNFIFICTTTIRRFVVCSPRTKIEISSPPSPLSGYFFHPEILFRRSPRGTVDSKVPRLFPPSSGNASIIRNPSPADFSSSSSSRPGRDANFYQIGREYPAINRRAPRITANAADLFAFVLRAAAQPGGGRRGHIQGMLRFNRTVPDFDLFGWSSRCSLKTRFD